MNNRDRLLWAGFTAILAAGVGFAVRGGIFDNWAGEYGFTWLELGAIGGAGFSGFCFGIIVGGVIADRLGYGKLVIIAFLTHVLSAMVTFAPQAEMDKGTVYNLLYWGMFLFAYGNGTLEAVANPLVATLFPEKRNHYLNLLHASWPAGMVLGAVCGWVLDDRFEVYWKWQLAIFLIPTIVYGLMFLKQNFPKSEAAEHGLSLGEMFKDVGILGAVVVCFLLTLFFPSLLPKDAALSTGISYVLAGLLLIGVAFITRFSIGSWLLFFLFVAHGLVGAVELGTDGWIQNITGNLLTSEQGKALFIWTSLIMFSLRFCADFIERKTGLTPVGFLLVCSILACVGLNLAVGMATFMGAVFALTIYAVGKAFFWPSMLAVASDRFPRTGAIAISLMGGIGMLSAGLLGSPGLGYAKDRFAGEALQEKDAALFTEYRAAESSQFLFFTASHGLDGIKLGKVQERLNNEKGTPDDKIVQEASMAGDRKTLRADSFIPAIMAIIYLLIALYFKSIGGYKPIRILGRDLE